MVCFKEGQRIPQSKVPITFAGSMSPTFAVSHISWFAVIEGPFRKDVRKVRTPTRDKIVQHGLDSPSYHIQGWKKKRDAGILYCSG